MSDPEELRPFANVRLIAFDLDGTLIGSPKDVPGQRLAQLFSQVARSNVWLTLATGRTLSGVEAALGTLRGLSKVPLVLYNGSVVIQPDDQILLTHKSLAPKAVADALRLVRAFESASAYVYSVDPDAGLVGGAAAIESVYFFGANARAPTVDFNGMPVQKSSSIDLFTARVVAMLVEARDVHELGLLERRLADIAGLSVTSSGLRFLEVRPAGSSKAVGVESLCTRLGITAQNVLAVGDNDNDVELLSWAGLSVSVDRSSTAARSASKFFSMHGAGSAAIEVLEIVRRSQRLFRGERHDGSTEIAQHQ